MRIARFLPAVLPLVLAATPIVASGQNGATLPGKWRISGGWLSNGANASVRLDSPRYGVGTEVDFEDDLGFKNTVGSVYAQVAWQFAERHRLDVQYNDIERTSIKTITREIVFGDQVYPVNAKIGGKFGTRFINLNYRYALYRREGFEIGPSVAIPFLTATVGAGVETASGQVQKEEKDVTVPAPLPGLFASARFHEKFYAQGNVQYMKATLFGVTVDMTDYRIQGVWLPTKHVGGGAAWSGNIANVKGSKEDKLQGKISYGVNGPSLFVTFVP